LKKIHTGDYEKQRLSNSAERKQQANVVVAAAVVVPLY